MTQLTFGRYRVIGDIPGGNMGRLYLAEDPEIERRVVVKALSGEFDQEQRARFLREARAAGRLSHRQIVSVFDVGEQERTPYLVMEYVQGETLAAISRRQPPISMQQRLDLLEQLCVGLDYAHDQGVVHRDIKPSNLMVDTSGTLRILDFGIARIEGDKTSTAILGTMNYMSPEQWSGTAIDRRTDIFAVGAVAYELFSGRKAFPGNSAPEVFRAVMLESPEPLEVVNPAAPAGLGDVIRRMLARAPEDRYDSLKSALPEIRRVRSEPRPEHDREETIVSTLRPPRAQETAPESNAPATRIATLPPTIIVPSMPSPVQASAKTPAAARVRLVRTYIVAGALVTVALVIALVMFVLQGIGRQAPQAAAPVATPTVTAAGTPTPSATPPVIAGRSSVPRPSPTSGRRGALPPECVQLTERFQNGAILTAQDLEFLKKRCGG